MSIIYLLGITLLILAIFLVNKANELYAGKRQAAAELQQYVNRNLSPFGAVKSLSVLPLIDFYTDRNDLKTEPGVSYLITADDTTILLDVGYNKKREHPSPLLQNIDKLGVNLNNIDMMFISHVHLDHIGGTKEQHERTFSLSQGIIELPDVPVFAPDKIVPSMWNPGPKVTIASDPFVLKPGIASTGVIPRYLFLMGRTLEHSLVINVAGKGLVLIVGCGHQTIERLVERVQALFAEPIYGIIGGLHYPVKGGRIMLGPLNIQHIVGSDNLPWNGLSEQDVTDGINTLKKVNPQLVALSAHDSSDWSMAQFKEAFKNEYVELKVGEKIVI